MLFRDIYHIDLYITNTIAWFLSIIFAYITNKLWVFESKSKKIPREFILFTGGRLFSFTIENLLLFVLVTTLTFNDNYVKIFAQVVVIILNYVLSKGIVFKSK
jgi:putative flippase GtrA